jgi:hypothetical protein
MTRITDNGTRDSLNALVRDGGNGCCGQPELKPRRGVLRCADPPVTRPNIIFKKTKTYCNLPNVVTNSLAQGYVFVDCFERRNCDL